MSPHFQRLAFRASIARVIKDLGCSPADAARHLFALGLEGLSDERGGEGLVIGSELFLEAYDAKLDRFAPDLVPKP